MRALALNAGSSTLKAALYDVEPGVALAAPPAARWEGQVDWDPGRGRAVAVEMLRGLCDAADAPLRSPAEVDVVGHRIVHGGARFRSPTRMTEDVKEAVGGLSASAPLHNAAGLAGVAAAEHFVGDATSHVAVFDAAFRVDLPPGAHVYAGPHEWLERGLRRFGFHGRGQLASSSTGVGRSPIAWRLRASASAMSARSTRSRRTSSPALKSSSPSVCWSAVLSR